MQPAAARDVSSTNDPNAFAEREKDHTMFSACLTAMLTASAVAFMMLVA
jgi:hypothetical protein